MENIVTVNTKMSLYSYQNEIGRAVLESVKDCHGYTFSVEIARQGGKNELSAQLETVLLSGSIDAPVNLIKCSPTFMPQALISMQRLKDRLNDANLWGVWETERGYIIKLGAARAIFLSADGSSNVVGNTAHLLLEVDEAQDVSKEKYSKEFRPMCSAYNTTTVLYGTTWDETTLLEEVKQTNLELERRDGVKRHFRYDWEEVSKYNTDYRQYVEAERARLGETHPLFLTQYRLLPIHGGGGFLSIQQRAQLQGEHPRRRHAEAGKTYVAGIDLAGEAETIEDILNPSQHRDAAVLTIAELDFSNVNDLNHEPALRVVEHYRWVGKKHPELYAQLTDILKNTWHCKRVVVDATGVGEPVASFLRKALGSRVEPFHFTAQSKSELGFNLLAAVNSGRLKVYKGDGSEEYKDFCREMEKARSFYRPSQTMNFFVDPSDGHDDFLMSLALTVEAGSVFEKRGARGSGEDYPNY
jgi:hypothetical protein